MSDYTIYWHDHLSLVSKDKLALIIANEFFDALPVRQFQYKDHQWEEHYINAKNESEWQLIKDPSIKDTLSSPKMKTFSNIQKRKKACEIDGML